MKLTRSRLIPTTLKTMVVILGAIGFGQAGVLNTLAVETLFI